MPVRTDELYELPELEPRPPQPPEEQWGFIDDLRRAVHTPPAWRNREPASHEADLRAGVSVQADFADPRGRLTTAYADFAEFLDV